jgi:hypothetical protein
MLVLSSSRLGWVQLNFQNKVKTYRLKATLRQEYLPARNGVMLVDYDISREMDSTTALAVMVVTVTGQDSERKN